MRVMDRSGWTRGFAVALMLAFAAAAAAAEPQSPRLDRAKDFIVDERWVRAIAELKAAADDRKERSRDEALFWLAHCHKEAGDPASALQAINRLENEFPRSRWIGPSRSLRIELAQRLNRTDVLWLTAVPPVPAVAPTPAPAIIEPAPPAPPHTAPLPLPAPRNPRPVMTPKPPAVATPAPAPPPGLWMPKPLVDPDLELRIQAMGSLILTDSAEAAKVIPILRDIALESDSPGPARRALFALAQSRLPEARSTVVEVAKTAAEPVQIEAVRVLGRLRGPEISTTLMNVYVDAGEPVKYQIVTSFGYREETSSLLRIVQSEDNQQIRSTAIVTLGRTPGGKLHLRKMYETAAASMKRPIIAGLFNARDDEGLIQIAVRERQAALREEVFERLRLLGTEPARQYLLQVRERREK
jgi:hypothetical protein